MITLICSSCIAFLIFPLYAFDATLYVKTMTLDQKIGQLFMVGSVVDENVNHDTIMVKKYRVDKEYVTQLIEKYHIGGIFWYGTTTPPEKIRERAIEYQEINSSTGNAIPLWFAQDLEPNFMQRFGCTDFSTAAQLGTQDNDKVEKVGNQIGTIAQKALVNIALAPVVDVNSNPKNPIIGARAFGSDPAAVTQKAAAFITGLAHHTITPCLKHFPGHGDTDSDSHLSLPHVSHPRDRLDTVELYPFFELIKQGKAPIIMIAHLAVPALTENKIVPTSLSETLIKKVLRSELGFTGLIMTDALDMQALFEYTEPGACELIALLAGNDILLSPTDVPKAVALIKKALADDRLSRDELDEHVIKILQAKGQHFDMTRLGV